MKAYRLEHHAVVRLAGDNALKFLHDVSTQDVLSLAPGDAAWLAFLTDKGRLVAFARALLLQDASVVLAADLAAREGLESAVRHAPLAGVEVEVEQPWPCIRFTGELETLGITPQDADVTELGDVLCVRPSWGENGWDLLCRHLAGIEDRIHDAGIAFGDLAPVEEARIAAGRPGFGVDVDATTLINETPLLAHAVSFTKGCYPGQESVARVHNLGRVNRRLRVLAVSAPAHAGDEVRTHDGSVVGHVTSAGRERALAWVGRDADVGARVTVGQAGAISGVEAIVTDAGWRTLEVG